MSKTLGRLSSSAVGLVGMSGMASLLLGFVLLPDEVRRLEELAASAQKVRTEVVSTRVKAEPRGRSGTTVVYAGVGDFKVVGLEGGVITDVPLQENWSFFEAAPIDEAAAKQLVQRFPAGRGVDAWFDPRSHTSPSFFPLSLSDPAPRAAERRGMRDLARWLGVVLVLAAIAGIVAMVASGNRRAAR